MHNPSLDTLSGFVDAELVRSGTGILCLMVWCALLTYMYPWARPASPGQKLGPRLHSTGTIVYGADGNARCEINSLQDARDRLNQLRYPRECRAAHPGTTSL